MPLEALSDEQLMRVLEVEGKGRRGDAPPQTVWNSIPAGRRISHPKPRQMSLFELEGT